MQKYDLDHITHDDILNGKMILVDKPLKWTSFDVVKYIRKSLVSKFKIKRIKVGHAGTLDPLATGLLIISTFLSGRRLQLLASIVDRLKIANVFSVIFYTLNYFFSTVVKSILHQSWLDGCKSFKIMF